MPAVVGPAVGSVDGGRCPQPGRGVLDPAGFAATVCCVDEQRHDPTTGDPRHRTPGAGPDDDRFPSARRRVDTAPLADPVWLGRLRADARSAGGAGARSGGRATVRVSGPAVPRIAVGARRASGDVRVGRPGSPDTRPGLSRWRAAAGPLVALTVVVAATVAVLTTVDRGGRAGAAGRTVEPTAGSAVSAVTAPAGPRAVTGGALQPSSRVATAGPVATPPARTPAPAAPTVTAPRVGTPPPGTPGVLVTGSPVEVLQALQAIRGAAFATGRLDLLRDVYPPGSELATADRASFAALAPTGGTVTGLGFDLRESAVGERTSVRAVVTALVRQRPVEVVTGASVRRLPGRDLGRVRVVLGRRSITDPWVITTSSLAPV